MSEASSLEERQDGARREAPPLPTIGDVIRGRQVEDFWVRRHKVSLKLEGGLQLNIATHNEFQRLYLNGPGINLEE